MTTRYEIVAHKGNVYWLIGYTPRVSRPGLVAAMQNVGDDMIERLGIDEEAEFEFGTAPRQWARIAGWMIEFTGRTQHDIEHGPERAHPFIGHYEEATA